ncbi:ATP-binding protein [Pseudomonas chlororaphis]|uniref:ATP-binding protein n=1 Tax=Pseudomonas chlororaphis TaxID=587753 RepID=UPI0006A5F943|nr:ATP-binding protein [Pseudomonas chlororaphis]AZC32484.1 Putative two-component sensor [Pseudomonas chlororaphis subsp. piscium]MBP5077167.1 sensor histidine kinase N-terminal domain-containing protein [Pseudomonas chlororaphis]WDG76893.1 ATP-binding protein [Pseudomonas chlororaphis]WDG83867.1 ATP-binding protein [Pseudomonas chlororaphis]WDG90196.1 ATP-binding protein [Pseudomonas chlororaphis]
MSLRLRLSLTIGAAFVLIWALAAAWMFSDLRNQMMFSLDQRLVASARMVAGLLEQLPTLPSKGEGTHFSAEQLNIPGGMACQVSSLRGEILARSHNHPDEKLEAERLGFHDQMIDGVRWRSFTLARGDLRITTADRQVEREALNLSVLLAASVPVGVALLACLWLLWLGIGQGLAPLNRMRDALMRRSADSLEPLQIHPLPSELRPLLETQNQLFQRIGKTIERERRLTGDAAHELRSPLTAIKTHLQVARMTDGAARDQSLARAEEGADRLHRTLEQLLLLARVEGSLSFEDGVQCNAEQVAKTAIQDAASGARQRVRLHIDERVSAAPLEMPSVLAIAALRNLLDNALRHTPSDAPVELNLETLGNRVRFQVRDHGSGIPEDDLQHLTQRFWRNGQSTGCGLGLAIVQAIVQRCGCVLHFDSRPDGLRVELTMPLQSA